MKPYAIPVLFLVSAFTACAVRLPAQEVELRTATSVEMGSTDHYPLDVCLVTQAPLTKDSVTFEVEGRKFKVADAKVREQIEKDPKPWLAKLDAAAIAVQAQDCALDRCPSCRGAFPASGEPIYVVHEGLALRVCKDACKVLRMARVSAAMVNVRAKLAQLTSKPYPTKACPVCDKALDDQATWMQHGWSMVKVHGACVTTFAITPNGYVAEALGRQVPAPVEAKKVDASAPAKASAGAVAPEKAKEPAAAPKRSTGGQ